MKTVIYLLTISCLLAFVACQSNTSPELPDERLMEQLFENNPDSLAYIL